jgi:hypothetical protein
MPLRNAHQHASTTSSSSTVETIDLVGGGGVGGGQGQGKKGRKRRKQQQGSNSVDERVGGGHGVAGGQGTGPEQQGSGEKMTKRMKWWMVPRNWNADRPDSGGEQTREAWVGPKKQLKRYGKKMWVDPSRIQGGSYVFAKVKQAGHEVWPVAKWHTPNTAIMDTPRKRAMRDIKVLGDDGNGNMCLSQWLENFSPVKG